MRDLYFYLTFNATKNGLIHFVKMHTYNWGNVLPQSSYYGFAWIHIKELDSKALPANTLSSRIFYIHVNFKIELVEARRSKKPLGPTICWS